VSQNCRPSGRRCANIAMLDCRRSLGPGRVRTSRFHLGRWLLVTSCICWGIELRFFKFVDCAQMRSSPDCSAVDRTDNNLDLNGGMTMAYTLNQFSTECHKILKSEPGSEGRQKICELLREVLKDDQFVATQLRDDTPERQVLYEDPELGFCILAHAYRGPKESSPHDHGPAWAIYGQAQGETEMSDWALVEPASEGKPGKVRHVKTYMLKPGMAHLYNEGDLHSPRRAGPTRLIRIEGKNMDKVRRLAYKPV
jgi:predicted metal-dependent enzyme (double-stranded beta helix superfamily)